MAADMTPQGILWSQPGLIPLRSIAPLLSYIACFNGFTLVNAMVGARWSEAE